MGGINILKASAGSGKTYQLSYRYIRSVVENPWLYSHILAVTFTNKATEEMKSRILNEINILASGARSPYLASLETDLGLFEDIIRLRATEARTKILHDYGHFNVVTIDKFFQRIIRSFIKELGIDLSFTLELRTDSILDTAADRLIDDIKDDTKLREWIMGFVEDRMDQNKKWDIKSEIASMGSEIFKERYKSVSQGHLPAEDMGAVINSETDKCHAVVAQMRAAATEALNAISKAGLSPSDLAQGLRGPAGYLTKVSNGAVEPYGKYVSDAVGSDEKWYSKASPNKETIISIIPTVRPLLCKICDTYDRHRHIFTTISLVKENFRSFALLDRLAQKVADVCAEMNIVPISETNSIISKLIKGNDTPFIYEKTGNSISHIMIDEFQDTSMQQWGNFIPLLENSLSQSEHSPVLLVGDVKQSIYRWRGGDWQILGQMVKDYFPETAESNLDTNYRSADIVVRFNNNIVEQCVKADNDQLNALLDDMRSSGSISEICSTELHDMAVKAYEGHKQKSSKEKDEGFVRITETPRDKSSTPEKPFTVACIEELQGRGYAPCDIAVLVRTNGEGRTIARELLDYKAANTDSPFSYDIVTQEALTIGNSDAINFIMAVMALSVTPSNAIQRAVYNRYMGYIIERELTHDETSFLKTLRLVSLEEAFDRIIMRYELGKNTNDIAYLQALQNQVHEFAASKIADIPLLLKWWNDTGTGQSINMPRNGNAITIITIHKAKGLEYKAVIIPYCSWPMQPKGTPMNPALIWARSTGAPLNSLGRVPVKWKKELADSYFAEDYARELTFSHIDNLNIFYVAATRAREELHIAIPEGQKPLDSIAGLISNSFTVEEGTIKIGNLYGRPGNDIYGKTYEFGRPYIKQTTVRDAAEVASFPTTSSEARLKYGTASARYFPDESEAGTSLRSYGIIMHKVFENIEDFTQIPAELERMNTNGIISMDEVAHVEQMINDAFCNPLIKSWFAPQWDMCRNESDIIVPRRSGSRRPDRVLTKGTRAVVIDYKFGLAKRGHYRTQILEYMELLRGMGYRDIEGYIWYVELNEVESIE